MTDEPNQPDEAARLIAMAESWREMREALSDMLHLECMSPAARHDLHSDQVYMIRNASTKALANAARIEREISDDNA